MDAETFRNLPHGAGPGTPKGGQSVRWWPTAKGFERLGWTQDEQGQWVPPVEVQRG